MGTWGSSGQDVGHFSLIGHPSDRLLSRDKESQNIKMTFLLNHSTQSLLHVPIYLTHAHWACSEFHFHDSVFSTGLLEGISETTSLARSLNTSVCLIHGNYY